ncbi:MAG: (deoxy)nucleoside triphosphate pyrophosphohydrolase [Actinomycetaceae bacterium]|nr:(deoxy)nucleoside triphosphate pyrophosphohydrolase [Actinomycetaceae bacterium]MDY5854281.1 (deoxy)nucleoside triphosphate pyrophosphohydrolase [Arcanobacterium sp.]
MVEANVIKVVGAAISDADGRILCAQRGSGRSLSGYWEFPGGKIELGESPQMALQREIREELHCEISVGSEVCTTQHSYDFATVVLTVFRATLISGTPERTEHAQLRWVEPQLMPDLLWAPADTEPVALLSQSSS